MSKPGSRVAESRDDCPRSIRGLVQDDFQLTLQYVLARIRTFPGAGGAITSVGDDVTRANYGAIVERIDRLAHALAVLGVEQGDRVGTFAWNSQRHLECYFAIPCLGAILHTINPRLSPDQIAYVVNHAEDRVVLVDETLVPILAPLAPRLH